MDPFDMLMGYDMGEEYGDVSGEDPFVGAAMKMALRPTTTQNMPLADLAALRRRLGGMRAARAVTRDIRLDALSKVDRLPATFMGVDSGPILIPAGGAVNVAFVSVAPVRILNFTVASGIATLFTINGIFIGRTNLLMSGAAIPADRFLPDSKRPPFEAPILPASVNGIMNVTNIGGAPARFLASFDVIDLSRRNPDCGA